MIQKIQLKIIPNHNTNLSLKSIPKQEKPSAAISVNSNLKPLNKSAGAGKVKSSSKKSSSSNKQRRHRRKISSTEDEESEVDDEDDYWKQWKKRWY